MQFLCISASSVSSNILLCLLADLGISSNGYKPNDEVSMSVIALQTVSTDSAVRCLYNFVFCDFTLLLNTGAAGVSES